MRVRNVLSRTSDGLYRLLVGPRNGYLNETVIGVELVVAGVAITLPFVDSLPAVAGAGFGAGLVRLHNEIYRRDSKTSYTHR